MKRFIALLAAVLMLTTVAMAAPAVKVTKKKITIDLDSGKSGGPMGIGLFLGQPTGIDFGMDLSDSSWLDVKAAWNLAASNGFSILLQGNYELAFPGAIKIEDFSLTPFVGAGVFVDLNGNGFGLGAHIPGGVSYRFDKVPLELFLELGLDVYLLPAIDLGGSGGLGIRYRF